VISDRDLDAQLAAAGGVSDADLPPLPEGFLAHLADDADAGLSLVAERPSDEPASVIAARQLVADAREHRGRRRPSRRTVLRIGAAVVVVAAAWTTAVVVTTDPATDRGDVATPTTSAPSSEPAGTPADGIQLVAAEEVAFPFSLDPAPEGLAPELSYWGGVAFYGGPVVFSASYYAEDPYADPDFVTVGLFEEDPRTLDGWSVEGDPVGTVDLGGTRAEVLPDEDSARLLWQRPDGRWFQAYGGGRYAGLDGITAVARTVVDRPQPLGLGLALAPAGWTVGGYEESRSLDLVSDADPAQIPLRVSVYGGPEYPATVDSPFEDRALVGPVEPVTVKGRPARIALADGYEDEPDSWLATGQLPDGTMFLMVAPPVLTRDQVLQIAEQVTYTP
jgi:hypothetical protein